MSNRKCVNCRHNKRIPKKTYVECQCDLDNHYIGYVECFDHWCIHWAKDHKFDNDEFWNVEYKKPKKEDEE